MKKFLKVFGVGMGLILLLTMVLAFIDYQHILVYEADYNNRNRWDFLRSVMMFEYLFLVIDIIFFSIIKIIELMKEKMNSSKILIFILEMIGIILLFNCILSFVLLFYPERIWI